MSTSPTALPDQSPLQDFERGLARGELRYQSCGRCSQAVFYPRVLCPHCGSPDLRWAASAGRGTVYSTTAIRRREETYNVALIDLDEGFRMMARVEGTPAEQVSIGWSVRARLTEGLAVGDLVFEPTSGEAVEGE
jgi:uncharacterized OB-fold protein